MIFNFVLGPPPPPGGPGGGSGLSFPQGNRRFGADSGPNPGIFVFGFKHSQDYFQLKGFQHLYYLTIV